MRKMCERNQEKIGVGNAVGKNLEDFLEKFCRGGFLENVGKIRRLPGVRPF